MSLTKAPTTAPIIDWTEVPQGSVGVSNEFDISASYKSAITIQAAVNTTAPHTGTEFIVQVTAQPSGNEDWGIFDTDEIGVELVGTGVGASLSNNPLAAGAVTLTMANTTGFQTYGEGGLDIDEVPGWRYIKDATLVNSELVYQTDFNVNTNIIVDNGVATNHVQNTSVWNVAIAKTVDLPDWASRAKVVVHNAYDLDGAAIDYRILGGKITDI